MVTNERAHRTKVPWRQRWGISQDVRMSSLIVIGFKNEADAFEMRAALTKLEAQYLIEMKDAVTCAVAAHMFKSYDSVLKVDGEVGNKKAYDPRSYLALAEASMVERVKQAATDLRGSGQTMFAK
jgi:hypothetical protein